MLVQRTDEKEVISWKSADESLTKFYSKDDVNNVLSSIGTKKPIYSSNNVVLLKPVNPKKLKDIHLISVVFVKKDSNGEKYPLATGIVIKYGILVVMSS